MNNGVNTGNAARFLLADKANGKKFRKLLEGKDIHRYSIGWGGNWINYDPGLKERLKLQDLDTRQAKIDFALRNPRIFDLPKIIIRQTSDKIIGCLDEDKYVTRHSTHCIVLERGDILLKYILAILNSRLMNFYYHTLIPEIGKAFAEVKAVYVKQFPIPPASMDQQKQIDMFVDRILKAKRSQSNADTSALEQEIDRLVYELYGLTEKEIAIVEGTAK